ncbi:MAG: leucyl aminopeptidase [Candidatus Obscuribacterales bacterium]|nr:leucyl aminopeptidase [Candidatus Obscuribacterales bacterium]
MQFLTHAVSTLAPTGEHTLITFCFEGDLPLTGKTAGTKSIQTLVSYSSSLLGAASAKRFSAKAGDLLLHYMSDETTARFSRANNGSVMLVGLGNRAKFNLDTLKTALVKVFRKTKDGKHADLALDVNPVLALGVEPYELGRIVGSYAVMVDHNHKHYKTSHSNPDGDFSTRSLRVVAFDDAQNDIARGLNDGRSLGESVNLARDLVTEPAGHLTPWKLMEAAMGVVATSGGRISGQYFHGDVLRDMGAHALLAVAQGSDKPPVLIELDYTPEGGPTKESLCLVGKSVTFDSGGLDLKPADGMRHMKRDMAGGAAVLGAIRAIAALKLPISVKVVMACTENMPDAKSYKPGDVINTMKGLTVEIDNTDAEGRLTLADAIEYAKRRGAKRIVDLATLTGAVKSIGGDVAAGLFGNNRAFTRMVFDAGHSVGELMQEMEMYPEMRRSNDSEIADLKNSGGGLAGSTTAAWFIREFAGEEIEWVHLDIAGVAWRDRSLGLDPKGSTGYGVRTAVALAQALSKKA